jgi:hypothetical protein
MKNLFALIQVGQKEFRHFLDHERLEFSLVTDVMNTDEPGK